MKKKDILYIIVFVTILSISFLYLFQTSYAKYRRKTKAELDGTIAQWNIKVNNETIYNKDILTNAITPTVDGNEHVKEGTLAPGSTGHFDIIVDAEEVDVDFTFNISTESEEENSLKDLALKSFQVDEGELNEDVENITGMIQKNTKKTTIRIYYEWNDDESNLMNNKEDTEYAKLQNYKIKIMINFEQKK